MASHIGILPKDVLDALVVKLNEAEAPQTLQFLRLPHPRTGIPSLFLPYAKPDGKSSIVEVQMVAPPNDRSWFMSEGQIVQDGKLLLMTPVDPAFLLVPILHALSPSSAQAGTFRPMDDMLEDAVEKLIQSAPSKKDPSARLCKEDLLHFVSLDCARNAVSRICEKKQITEELAVYKYSPDVVLENLRQKVARLNSQAMFDASRTLTRALAKDGLMDDGKDDLLEMGRLKASCDLVSQYVPDHLHKQLLASYDFAPLEKHLAALAEEAVAQAAADMKKVEMKESKGSAAEKAGGKKRKTASMGVEKLKKANTKGMAKLSTFFQAKA
ncbi:ribonuclease H2, subunit [Phanerochaete sordida]|uniref:Ribonuclease H2 subunit B n=1 Tax=Phanerochaete sordida TaxID=48140 RepID=A0A9P3GCL4_9APHY|nr:ribonuclease H2, subunit [Phanerochaete sordida]